MTDNDNLRTKLVALADLVLDDLLAGESALEQRIDALKAIGTLHLGLAKISAKVPEEDTSKGIPAMREKLRLAGGDK